MEIIIYSDNRTWIHWLDPRGRILGALAGSVTIALCTQPQALAAALVIACLAAAAARVPVPALLQRLVPLNALLILLAASALFFTPGEPLFHLGGASASHEGLAHAARMALKANAIVLLLAALVGSIELVDLGHALSRLRVPPMLTHILLFTIRYLNLMLAEFERLSRAAQLRGFVPGANPHTLRTTGYMVGMMLVRSYARGERILDAMRLRGYNGVFAFDGDLAYARRDAHFGVLALVALALVAGLEWR